MTCIGPLIAEFAAKERVTLHYKPIMAALLSLHWSLMQSPRLIPIIREVLEQQCSYQTFFLATA